MNELFKIDFDLNYFHFENPLLLLFINLALLLVFFEFNPGRKFKHSISKLRKFIDYHLIKHLITGQESRKKTILRTLYSAIIFALFAFALSNPRWNYEELESYKSSINVVFAIDISKSMDTQDVRPSRIDRVKQEVQDIINKIPDANFGLIAFAKSTHVVSPLTDDIENFKYLLSPISTDLVSIQGTNLESVYASASLMFNQTEGGINYLVVMSDGEFEGNIPNRKLLDNAKVQVVSYAFGTPEGSPIALKDGGYLKYNDKIIISKLNKNNLIKLSGAENFIEATYLDDDITKLSAIIKNKDAFEKAKYQKMTIWFDRFYIPLTIAMVMMLVFFRKGAFFPVILLLISLPFDAHAQNQQKFLDKLKYQNIKKYFTEGEFLNNSDQQAIYMFYDNKFDEAEQHFSEDYNKGVASYRNENYSKAEDYFENAISQELNPQDARYNLGNSYLMQGKFDEAIKTYQQVLSVNPNHEDAKFNLELAKKFQNNQQAKQDLQNKAQEKREEQNQQKQNNQNSQQNKNNQTNQQQKNNSAPKAPKRETVKDIQAQEDAEKARQRELNAKVQFEKLSNDANSLLKNRFEYEENKLKENNKMESRPW